MTKPPRVPDENPNILLDTLRRMEPNLANFPTGPGMVPASVAISLRRIADALESEPEPTTATAVVERERRDALDRLRICYSRSTDMAERQRLHVIIKTLGEIFDIP